jgi:hypothetical protein
LRDGTERVTDRVVDQGTIERYLLGELSPDEQAELETRYFGDPELLDRIEAAEDELIDDYVREELVPARRLRFESHFLNEKRLERVRMAEALHMECGGSTPLYAPKAAASRRTPYVLPAAAALFGAALLAIVWLFVHNRGLEQRIATLQAERDAARVEIARRTAPPQTTTTTPEPPRQPPAPLAVVASIVLSPGLTRDGGDVAIITVEPETRMVRIELRLETSAKRYDATLQRAGEPPLWTGSGLVAQTIDGERRLVLYFPREQFTAGDYLLTLTAPDVIADYAFTLKFS